MVQVDDKMLEQYKIFEYEECITCKNKHCIKINLNESEHTIMRKQFFLCYTKNLQLKIKDLKDFHKRVKNIMKKNCDMVDKIEDVDTVIKMMDKYCQ